MERDEMLVVSAEVVHSKKSDTDFCILNGIYTDNYGKLTSKPIMTTPDVQKGFDGCGVYKCSFGFGGAVTGIELQDYFELP